jgi:hypothetical protein
MTRRTLIRHQPIADRLRAHPNQWGQVSEYRALYVAQSVAAAIRTGSLPAYQPAGSFEADVFANRASGGNPIVRARYIGRALAAAGGAA